MLRLKRISWQALILLVLLFSITLGIIMGSAAANIVPASYASETSEGITIEQLTPPECAGMGLIDIVIIGKGQKAGNNSSLILGTSGNDMITGKKGNDCIVGGGGNDTINGKQGDDVILGGDGDDTINGKQGYDYCYGGAGADTFANCEEVIDIP